MCPATITLALVAAGTAVSAIGAIQQGQSQASASKYNAAVAEQNAGAAKQQAEAAAMIQQEQAKKAMGSTVAAYGASGVSMEGTPLDVLANSASVAERDRQNIMYKGKLQAAGYQSQADLDRRSATNSLNQGYMKATGILLSGGAKVYGMMPSGNANAGYGQDEL
jgi:hypothetical protein